MHAAMQTVSLPRRIGAALAALVAIFALGAVLLSGLTIKLVRHGDQRALALFTAPALAPPPPPEPVRAPSGRDRPAAAAPPAKKARATPAMAPSPVIRLPAPSPLIAAPHPIDGSEQHSGAADQGDGNGASGSGEGRGGGGDGDGTGSGLERPSERIAGTITNADYPKAASRANAQGSVIVRYIVGTDGRAHDCTVLRSSGNSALDATTCRLIEKRFRFRPALDAAGNKIADPRGWQQRWWFVP